MTRTNKKTDYISLSDILFYSNGGMDIYEKELNLIHKGGKIVALCPFHNEKTPSFHLFGSPNKAYKCFGCGKGGKDIVKFMMERYGYDYKTAIQVITATLGLNKDKVPERPKNVPNELKSAKKRKLLIEFNSIPFTVQGHEYWNSFRLSEDFLKKFNVYQVSMYSIDKKVIKPKEGQTVFAYDAGKEGVKLLTLGQNVENKWISNIKGHYLWGYNEYVSRKVDILFISKSWKDNLVLRNLGYEGICTQSESSQVLIKHNIQKINDIANHPLMAWGSDKQGQVSSKEVTDVTGWKWVNPPKYMLQYGINDMASYCKEFGEKALDNEIKKRLKRWKL